MKFPPLTTALLFVSACSAKPAADWSSIRAHIARAHPEVEHITTRQLWERLASGENVPLLIDARTRAEFDVSHLPGALWAPSRAAARALLEGVSPEEEIVVYCSVGLRSAQLTRTIAALGFLAVRNLDGSLFAWANAGHPLVRRELASGVPTTEIPTGRAHPFDEHWGRLLRRDLWEWEP